MRRAVLVLALLLAGCGGTLGAQKDRMQQADGGTLDADGISATLPAGWDGRIVLGQEGRPILHAASFALPTNDEDSGEVAKESMGIKGMYVNVRDLGPGDSPVAWPFTFSPSDFGPPPPGPGSLCCRVTEASKEVAFSGELFRLTAISGGEDPPADAALQDVQSLLHSLSITPYSPSAIPSLPADATKIEGHGISMRLPPGWDGSVTRGRLQAESPGRQLRLRLLEEGGSDAAFETGTRSLRLTPAEFVPPGPDSAPGALPAETGRSFSDAGRDFVLWVESDALPPDASLVDQANEALATLDVQPGNFYPGTVKPATFAPANGWHTGSGGSVDVQADGQQTWSWASTVPYVDDPQQFPPRKTLEQLPPDGIVIDVMLYGATNRAGPAEPPFQIAQAQREYPWEGQVGEIPLYAIGARAPGKSYEVEISVLFGRNRPTREQVAAADAELARLDLPDWSAAASRAAR